MKTYGSGGVCHTDRRALGSAFVLPTIDKTKFTVILHIFEKLISEQVKIFIINDTLRIYYFEVIRLSIYMLELNILEDPTFLPGKLFYLLVWPCQ